jgi:putative PIN family toxin of toxin-antitoxin system
MIVLDTDVVVAGLRSPKGASAEVMRRVLNRDIVVAMSVAMMLEYEAVATRKEHLDAGGLSVKDVLIVLDALASLAHRVEINFQWRPQLRDADDEMILEAAVNAGAEAIVTFNRQDFKVGKTAFGIDILLPVELIRRV